MAELATAASWSDLWPEMLQEEDGVLCSLQYEAELQIMSNGTHQLYCGPIAITEQNLGLSFIRLDMLNQCYHNEKL